MNATRTNTKWGTGSATLVVLRAARPVSGFERARLVAEVDRAIAFGGDVPALVAPFDVPDADELRAALTTRTKDWRQKFRSKHLAAPRLVLQYLVDLPIEVQKGSACGASAIVDVADLIHQVASPKGSEERRQLAPATFVVGIAAWDRHLRPTRLSARLSHARHPWLTQSARNGCVAQATAS